MARVARADIEILYHVHFGFIYWRDNNLTSNKSAFFRKWLHSFLKEEKKSVKNAVVNGPDVDFRENDRYSCRERVSQFLLETRLQPMMSRMIFFVFQPHRPSSYKLFFILPAVARAGNDARRDALSSVSFSFALLWPLAKDFWEAIEVWKYRGDVVDEFLRVDTRLKNNFSIYICLFDKRIIHKISFSIWATIYIYIVLFNLLWHLKMLIWRLLLQCIFNSRCIIEKWWKVICNFEIKTNQLIDMNRLCTVSLTVAGWDKKNNFSIKAANLV